MRWSETITVVDCHAQGESGKVVTGGVFDVPGPTMFDKKRHLELHRDGLRKFLLFEPRGTVNHNANIILPTSIFSVTRYRATSLPSSESAPAIGSCTIRPASWSGSMRETGSRPGSSTSAGRPA